MRVIHENGNYRIIEIRDTCFDLENLEGDTYNPDANPDIPENQLKEEQDAFHDLVSREGVYGYVLQKWNPEINTGWEDQDSCFGFVGQCSENEDIFNHYIIKEMISMTIV